MNLNQVTLPAFDIPASVDFYRRLGLKLIVDAAHYARFECPDGDATLSVHRVEGIDAAAPAPHRTGATVFFECADLDARVAALQAGGIDFTQLPRDEPWLWREARLLDPAGNTVCLYFAGPNRKHPPWRVS